MRVLRLRIVGIKLRQPHIPYLAPLSRAGLYIAVLLVVKGVLLYAVIQVKGVLQSLSVARSACILRKTVYGKGNGIELLLSVQRLTLVVHAPVHTSVFWVYKVVYQVVFRPCGSFQQLLLLQHPVGSREGPQYAGIEYGAFLGIGVQHSATVYTAVKATILVVLHFLEPEGQDVVFQHILHLQPHHIQMFFVHFLIG